MKANRRFCVKFMVLSILALALNRTRLHAGEAKSILPEGLSGIAARYPGDDGIEKHPAIIFVEKFNEG